MILFSSWVNIALYTIELLLCARYFARPSRTRVHRMAVGVMIFFDTLCTVVISINICMAVLGFPMANLQSRLLLAPLAMQIFTTYVSSVVSQLFLCNLFYLL
jgi:hypothetical protein